jgi:acetyl esterase/lipase
MQTIRYGQDEGQEGDLHLPGRRRPAVVCLLHGGFWRMPHGREQMTPIAEDLASRGFAVWNLEYRRLGTPGAGWPGTLEDVADGIEHLDLDLDRVTVVGHSAGGHLALWSAARPGPRGAASPRVRVAAAIGLAPIADLARAYESGVGGEAVAELIGGAPGRYPERFRAASPVEMLPLGIRQLLLHGTADHAVPIELSRRYARMASAAGDDVELVELPGAGHMDFLDPDGEAHAILCRWLLALEAGGGRTAPSRPDSP